MKTSDIFIGTDAEVSAAGCNTAGSYREFARQQGCTHIEVLNWSSSAGGWEFIVSKDGVEWQILCQTNNYPRSGFSHTLTEDIFYGTAEEVFRQIEEIYQIHVGS